MSNPYRDINLREFYQNIEGLEAPETQVKQSSPYMTATDALKSASRPGPTKEVAAMIGQPKATLRAMTDEEIRQSELSAQRNVFQKLWHGDPYLALPSLKNALLNGVAEAPSRTVEEIKKTAEMLAEGPQGLEQVSLGFAESFRKEVLTPAALSATSRFLPAGSKIQEDTVESLLGAPGYETPQGKIIPKFAEIVGPIAVVKATAGLVGTVMRTTGVGAHLLSQYPKVSVALSYTTAGTALGQAGLPLDAIMEERARIFTSDLVSWGTFAVGMGAKPVQQWLPIIFSGQYAGARIKGAEPTEAFNQALLTTAVMSIFKITEYHGAKKLQAQKDKLLNINRQEALRSLGINKPIDQVSQGELKSAYRRMAHLYHPDKPTSLDPTGKQFIELQRLYKILTENPVQVERDIWQEISQLYRELTSPQARGAALATIENMPLGLSINDINKQRAIRIVKTGDVKAQADIAKAYSEKLFTGAIALGEWTETIKEVFPYLKDNDIQEIVGTVEKFANEDLPLGEKLGLFADYMESKITKTAPITKESDALIKEAKKYKSAEEFIETQTVVYRGMRSPIDATGGYEVGKFVTLSKENAQRYAKKEGAEVREFVIPKDLKTLVYETPEADKLTREFLETLGEERGGIKRGAEISEDNKMLLFTGEAEQAWVDFLRKKGYEATSYRNISAGLKEPAKELHIFDPAQIKTKAQLADIWERATATPPGIPGVRGLRRVGLGKEPSKLIAKKPETLLKERIKNYARGFREGRAFTKKEIKAAQKDLTSLIQDSGLEAADKAKFIPTIKNIQTEEQFAKALESISRRIRTLERESTNRAIRAKIKQELKTTKPTRVGYQMVGKYDYKTNKFFDQLRKYHSLKQSDALSEMLSQPPAEEMTESDRILQRMLSLRANGAAASSAIHKKVLEDIQKLKVAGQQAKSEEDLMKAINKQEAVRQLRTAILTRKGNAKNILTKAENLYRLGFANIDSLIQSIVGQDIASKYEVQLAQDAQHTASYFATKTLKAGSARDLGVSVKSFPKKLHDMAQEEFEIIDKNGVVTQLSRLDLIDIYNSVKNPIQRARYHNAFGIEQVDLLLTNLTQREMLMADRLQRFVQSYRSIYNQRSIDLRGRDMGVVENYWVSTAEREIDVFDDYTTQGNTPSAIKMRAKSEQIVPRPTNAWVKAIMHMELGEHVKYISPIYDQLKRDFANKNVRQAIKDKYGKEVYNSLNKHIERLSINYRVEELDAFSGIFNAGLNNWVKAKLVSPSVFVRQIVTFFNYMENMPVGVWHAGFAEGLLHPKKTFDFMWKNAPFLEARFNQGYSEALRDALNSADKFMVGKESLTRGVTAMTRTGDIGAIIYGGYPKVIYEIKKHGDIARAFRVFERETLNAQQSGLTSSRSHIQNSSNPAARLVMRFKNTQTQYLRKIVDSMIAYRNKEIPASHLAKTFYIYGILNVLLYSLAGSLTKEGFKAVGRGVRGERQEIDVTEVVEDIVENLAVNPFQAIPLLDDVSRFVYRTATEKQTYGVLQTPMVDEVVSAIERMGRKSIEDVTLWEWLEFVSILQEPATGLPTQALLRHYRYLTTPPKRKLIRTPAYR